MTGVEKVRSTLPRPALKSRPFRALTNCAGSSCSAVTTATTALLLSADTARLAVAPGVSSRRLLLVATADSVTSSLCTLSWVTSAVKKRLLTDTPFPSGF